MPPTYYGGEAYQMFSQRNNPYCDLLQNCIAKIDKIYVPTILAL